jgi:hypothetical protein
VRGFDADASGARARGIWERVGSTRTDQGGSALALVFLVACGTSGWHRTDLPSVSSRQADRDDLLIATGEHAYELDSAVVARGTLRGHARRAWTIVGPRVDLGELDDLTPDQIACLLGWQPALDGPEHVDLDTGSIRSMRSNGVEGGPVLGEIGVGVVASLVTIVVVLLLTFARTASSCGRRLRVRKKHRRAGARLSRRRDRRRRRRRRSTSPAPTGNTRVCRSPL